MNDTQSPANTDLPGVSPLNAFVAALADQVFQRVTVLLTEKLATLTTEDTMPKDQIKTLVDERLSVAMADYDPTEHGYFDDAVENLVETWIDRNLDVSDAVRECIDSSTDLEEKIRDVVKGMSFTVEAS